MNTYETGALRRKSSLNIRDTRIAGLYDLERTIGHGHFAVVKLAKHVFTGEKVAVKIIDKTKIDEASTSHIMKEVRCMKLVQHANIVRLYEVLDTQTKMFLILELGDYDLHDFIIKHEKGVSESLAQQYFCQIMTAIDYCHQLHVVHRDLKPENVVFFEKLGMVKLTDFGFSNCYEPGQQLSTSCGSLAYSAPEILLGDSYDAPAVDVWSLGVILYMLVCGRLPFQEANDSETLTKILDCKYSIPDVLSSECRSLIQSMLIREPQKRATLDKICSNQWVVAGDRGLSTAIPLIVRHHLPPSAHSTIIEQMVAGNIASEEDILTALENDDYNSVTATYYLLAERVLASYREEQAREILSKYSTGDDKIEMTENVNRGPGNPAQRCRSRSNSWRARPCSILKEESEEELSTYLRSASRQSSRFFQLHDYISSPRSSSRCCSAQISRQNSEEALTDDGRPTTFYLPSATTTTVPPSTTLPQSPSIGNSINRFEDVLSPIDECCGTEHDGNIQRNVLNEIIDDSLNRTEEHEIRKSSDSCLHAKSICLSVTASTKRLLRRNSSPSVSMFAGIARDRVSPQAVQDLLELNRLGGYRGRAASPESVRSSRSPSPPASSSGRTSPAMSTLSSLSRLKVSAPNITNSGMRKLSSSPHLLGICEESEEGHDSPNTLDAIQVRTVDERMGRANSAVRMIRPRQAIVSPDVCRRYEQHSRFITKTRRSTSCSSSEASDDDDGRRLTMISTKCASKFDERKKKDEDDDGEGGINGKRANNTQGGSYKNDTNKASTSQSASSPTNNDKRTTMKECAGALRPIPEMTLLDNTIESSRNVQKNRLLNSTKMRNCLLTKWIQIVEEDDKAEIDKWLGTTPPREIGSCEVDKSDDSSWYRTLRRTLSNQELTKLEDEEYVESRSDSGCSSEGIEENRNPLIQNMYNDSKFSFLNTLPMEKVDKWLQSAEFVC